MDEAENIRRGKEAEEIVADGSVSKQTISLGTLYPAAVGNVKNQGAELIVAVKSL